MSEQGFIKLYKGRVVNVDQKNWSCTVLTAEMGPVENVPIAPITIGTNRKGAYFIPQVDGLVYMACFQGGKSPFILCGAPMVKEKGDSESSDPDYSFDRDAAAPGDFIISNNTGQLAVRKDGTIEIGASPLAQRFYIPIKNIIRDICKNFSLYSAAGNLAFTTDEDTFEWGTITQSVMVDRVTGKKEDVVIPRIPTQFKLDVKEFIQDGSPVMSLEVGRINVLHDPLVGGVNWEDIILRFNVRGPDGSSIRYFMDKQGVVNFYTAQSQVNSCGGKYAVTAKEAIVLQTEGLIQQGGTSKEVTISGGKDDYTVDGNVLRRFLGDTIVELGANLKIQGEPESNIVLGNTQLRFNGNLDQKIVSDHTMNIGGKNEVTIGGSSNEFVTGSKEISVGNKDVSAKSFKMTVFGGVMTLESKALAPSPYSTGVQIKAGLARALFDQSGNVYLRSSPAGPNLQLSSTGGILSNGSGFGVNVDRTGKVHLGTINGTGHGKVVTTNTHPVCFVTGLPIRGSSFVTASGPGVPGPATPGTSPNTAVAADTAITTLDSTDKIV